MEHATKHVRITTQELKTRKKQDKRPHLECTVSRLLSPELSIQAAHEAFPSIQSIHPPTVAPSAQQEGKRAAHDQQQGGWKDGQD